MRRVLSEGLQDHAKWALNAINRSSNVVTSSGIRDFRRCAAVELSFSRFSVSMLVFCQASKTVGTWIVRVRFGSSVQGLDCGAVITIKIALYSFSKGHGSCFDACWRRIACRAGRRVSRDEKIVRGRIAKWRVVRSSAEPILDCDSPTIVGTARSPSASCISRLVGVEVLLVEDRRNKRGGACGIESAENGHEKLVVAWRPV